MFQEVAAAAYGLQLPFLWIDSLCILQDNLQDFGVEAASMREVYSYSALKLSATANTSNERSRFYSRKPEAFLRTILTSESSVDPSPNAYYLERLRTDKYIHHHPDGCFLERDCRIEFRFDEPVEALEFQTIFGLYLCVCMECLKAIDCSHTKTLY